MEYQINLSTGELYTLAGLLHFRCLYGIENDTLQRWQPDLPRHIRQTVTRLENRKLIFLELHGKLLIEASLKTVMELMACPERIVVVSGSAKNGRTATMYVFERGGVGITVSRLDEDNYKIVMYRADEIMKLLCSRFVGATDKPLHERLLLAEAQYIQAQIASFQAEEARARLEKCVTDPKSTDFIFSVLKKETDFTEARFLRRKNGFYETKSGLLIAFDGDHSVTLAIDEHGVLLIDSLEKENADNRITDFFGRTQKECS